MKINRMTRDALVARYARVKKNSGKSKHLEHIASRLTSGNRIFKITIQEK